MDYEEQLMVGWTDGRNSRRCRWQKTQGLGRRGRGGGWQILGHWAEGLVDLVGGDTLVVEEGTAADDSRAPDLGVGGELDRVLDVVLPQQLRLRRRLEGLRLRLAARGVCCCSRWSLQSWHNMTVGES